MTTLEPILGPEEVVFTVRTTRTDIASVTTCTHDGDLATIFLGEICCLEGEIRRRGSKLLELELVHAGGDKGKKEQQGREPVEEHGGGWRERGRRVVASLYDVWRRTPTAGMASATAGTGARRNAKLRPQSPRSPLTEHPTRRASTGLASTSKASAFSPATPSRGLSLAVPASAESHRPVQESFQKSYFASAVAVDTAFDQMASSKNTTRNAEAAADPSKMSNLERLILVQAVYEFGNSAWSEVNKLLSSHPMLAQSKLRFSPQVSLTNPHLCFIYRLKQGPLILVL